MTRSYTPQSVITVPRLNGSYTSILIMRLQTAAAARQQALAATGQVLPPFIARALTRLEAAAIVLRAALQLEPPGDPSATREADGLFDDACVTNTAA